MLQYISNQDLHENIRVARLSYSFSYPKANNKDDFQASGEKTAHPAF